MSVALDSPLHVVEVDDRCDAELVGHTGCTYTSPPQPAGQALRWSALLLSCPQQPPLSVGGAPWRRAAAAGTLTIRLQAAIRKGQLNRSDPPPPRGQSLTAERRATVLGRPFVTHCGKSRKREIPKA